jgi:hypothetical protein
VTLQFVAICFTCWKMILSRAKFVRKETLQQWAKRFTRDLKVDGVDVDFDGTVREHLDSISNLRAKRLSWERLYNAVKAAGGRRKSGQPFSEGQWRMALSRARRAREAEEAKRRSVKRPRSRRPQEAFARFMPKNIEKEFDVDQRSGLVSDAGPLKYTPLDEVSPDDIATVLSRIDRAK